MSRDNFFLFSDFFQICVLVYKHYSFQIVRMGIMIKDFILKYKKRRERKRKRERGEKEAKGRKVKKNYKKSLDYT